MQSSISVRVRLTDTNRRLWISTGLFSGGLALAILAQHSIYYAEELLAGVILYAVAFALLTAAWARDGSAMVQSIRTATPATSAPAKATPAKKLFVLPALLLALIAFFELGGNRFAWFGTAAWLAALVLFLFAFWEGSPAANVRRLAAAIQRQPRWVLVALAGVMVLGGIFYFYRLDMIPAEMTSDHAEKVLDTRDILQGTYYIFFERNTGREPLQFYLNALVVALGIAPLDMLALKVVGATAGLLTIPAVFLLGREMFDEKVGLVAAFLFAVSIYPVGIARVGLRYPLAPLFVAWMCWFLLRGLRYQSRNDFLLAGLMMGIGLNGYSPFRAAVIVAATWVVIWFLFGFVRRGQASRLVVSAGLMFGAALLVFLPLARYVTEHPGNFAYRMATRLTSLEEPVQGNPIATFLQNNLNALGMFNVHGDVVWVNAIPRVPVVDYILGACFLIGVVYGTYRLLRYREYPFALMFAALFVLLLPSTLALAFPEENPSVVRAGGVTPFVMILASLPLVAWRRQFSALGTRTLGDVLLGAVLLLVVVTNFQLYFYRYDLQYRLASWNSTEIADALREFALGQGDWEHIYIMSTPHWVDHRAVGIHAGNYDFDSLIVGDKEELQEQATDPAAKLYVLKNTDLTSQIWLEELYPDGVRLRMPSRTQGRDFIAYYVPAHD
jgi:4-amino-4-deoxy-L-arabinose transferase-like glycosyltransferase